MTIGSPTAGFPAAALRRLARAAALAAALAGLTACSAYDEVFGEEPVPGIVTTGTGDQQDAVVPSLASVPDRPTPSTAAQRQALQDSLRRDRSRAVYADQPAAATPSASEPSEAAASRIIEDLDRPTLPEDGSSAAQSRDQSPSRRSDARTQTSAVPTPVAPRREAPAPPRSDAPAPRSGGTAAPNAVGPAQIQQYNLPQRPNYSEMAGVIFFNYGSAGLDSRDIGVLRQVVEMQQQRGGTLRVVGHASMRTGVTDPVKHNLANFNMSLQRAQAVAERLEALGAPAVVVEAMGSAQPVYYEFMPTGEAGNRRAEIFLDY